MDSLTKVHTDEMRRYIGISTVGSKSDGLRGEAMVSADGTKSRHLLAEKKQSRRLIEESPHTGSELLD